MSVKVIDLINEIKMATGAEQPSTWTDPLLIINQAVAYFNSMHPWDTMVGPEVSLDSTAAQSYIVLPDDVRDVIALEHTEGTTNWIKWVDPARLTQLRAYDDDDEDYVGGYYVCISRAVPDSGGGLQTRLEVYPTPASTSTTGLMAMRYRRKLLVLGTDSNADTQYINVSAELEPLLRLLVRLYAKGIEEEDEGGTYQRLSSLEDSPFLDRLKEMDGAMQPEVGVLRGGAAEQTFIDSFWWDTAIGDPS